MMSVRGYLALGSNLGDRLGALGCAVQELDATPGIAVHTVSSAYETEPWGVTDQPPFANAVIEVASDLDPAGLLAACKTIEASMGRRSSLRFGPRPIDIDILLFGDERIDTPELTIPHPRMLERDFVITPLLEIAPEVTVPGAGRPDRAAATEGRVTGILGSIPRTP